MPANRTPIITLTTDFGLSDGYVGAMKGVLHSIVSGGVTVVDISHHVPPQDIVHGAFALNTAFHQFPEGTIHVAIVDPGVGTDRKAIAVRARGYSFIGPDNGVTSLAIGLTGHSEHIKDVKLNSEIVGVELTTLKYQLPSVSTSFHGRDIFAPAAGYLANGINLDQLGPRIHSMQCLGFRSPRMSQGNLVEASIIHVDGFGNLITNVRPESITGNIEQIRCGGRIIRGVSATYANSEDFVAFWGSDGYLEIAINKGNAAASTGLGLSDPVYLTLASD